MPGKADFNFTVGDYKKSELAILSTDRKQAYTLQCSPDQAGYKWVIGCELFAVGSKVDLLADSVDQFTRLSRAIFLGKQFGNECQSYPEWGTSRNFSLRGMNIRFTGSGGEFMNYYDRKDPTFGHKVEFHVKVTPDASARSPVAMPIETVDWSLLGEDHHHCRNVLTHSLPH
jgi:hypothetical protein